MSRIMGLDYGSVTVGVALSDPMKITAQGLEVIRRKEENKLRRTLARLTEIIEEYEVELIVLGFPKNMNNTVGFRCERTKEFAEKLSKRVSIPIEYEDERLSTVEAHNAMIEGNVRREKREQIVDMVAATIILERYLDRRNHQNTMEPEYMKED